MTNGSDNAHSIGIRVDDSDTNTVFEDTFEMVGLTANEGMSIDGTPSNIYVTIDSNDEQELSWPLEAGDRVSEVNIENNPIYHLDQDVFIHTVQV
ncbi:hypothetical protein [Natronococcus wangiae]|uniref:hypothetical protein n=1 Tax=Natronococcus wangiae TaxID=3068275 RepID=UPI00273D3C59|nr:hypothetical protein [Natronococcus sp. AD5]